MMLSKIKATRIETKKYNCKQLLVTNTKDVSFSAIMSLNQY